VVDAGLDVAEESRDPVIDCLLVVDDGLVAVLGVPPMLALGAVFVAGAGGGAIVVLPVVLNLDLVLESEVLAVVAGVVVLGVLAAELAELTALVGDFVGDCTR
jgi:hypothetical protein